MIIILFALLFTPFLASAQTVQELLGNLTGLFDAVIIPFILGVAFVIFLINAVRYFVIGATNDDAQENAKNLAIYSIAAFVFILSFWGIVNLVADGIGLNPEDPCLNDTTSDYMAREAAPCRSTIPPRRPTN